MEPQRHTVSVVAELSVQDDLKESLLDLGHRAVELIEHQENRLVAGSLVPGGRAEGRDPAFLRSLEVRDSTNLGLVHGATADVDEGKTKGVCDVLGYVRLTDTGRASHQCGDIRREMTNAGLESFDVHDLSLREGVSDYRGEKDCFLSPPSIIL